MKSRSERSHRGGAPRGRTERPSYNFIPVVILVVAAVGLLILFRLPVLQRAVPSSELPISVARDRGPTVTVASDRHVFSPNNDANQDTVLAIYNVSNSNYTSAEVTVDVLDESSRVVRTLVRDKEQAMGQHSLIWNGRDEGGGVVNDGRYRVRVTAQTEAGTNYNNTQVEVDTQPPVIRLANVPENYQTKDSELAVQGVTDPNATVWINDDPRPVTLDGGGGFTTRRRLQEGENRIEIVAIDEAGNSSSIVRNVTLLTEPPELIVDNPPDGIWLNQKLLTVQGRADPGSTVEINGKDVTVEDRGVFETEVLLQEGENTVRVESTDAVGNTAKAERSVYLKTDPPPISVTNLEEGMVVNGPSLRFSGETEPEATLLVNGQEVPLDRRGGFQAMVNLVEGDNTIKLDVRDRAGNVSTLQRTVRYEVVSAGGTAPETGTRESSLLRRRYLGLSLPELGIGGVLIIGIWLWLTGALNPASLSLSIDRQTFAPHRSGESDSLVVAVVLSRSSKVTVEIIDDYDRSIALLADDRKWDAGEHYLVWDGRDDYGKLVPSGSYYIEASAGGLASSVTSSVDIHVDTEPSIFRLPREMRRDERRDDRRDDRAGYEGD